MISWYTRLDCMATPCCIQSANKFVLVFVSELKTLAVWRELITCRSVIISKHHRSSSSSSSSWWGGGVDRDYRLVLRGLIVRRPAARPAMHPTDDGSD